MLMVQTSEYIEDSHHQYELASLEAECGCACIYFICKVVYCNIQPFSETSMTIWCVYTGMDLTSLDTSSRTLFARMSTTPRHVERRVT